MLKKWIFILGEKQSLSVIVNGEQDNLRFHESMKKPDELFFVSGENRSAYVNLRQVVSIVIEDIQAENDFKEKLAKEPAVDEENICPECC